MIVTLKDGSKKEYSEAITVIDIETCEKRLCRRN